MSPLRDPAVCPFLGLPGDPATRFATTTVAHRCHAKRRTVPIAITHQAAFCLTPAYPTCRRFPARLTPADGAQVVAAGPRSGGSATSRNRRSVATDAAIAVVLLLLVVVVIAAVAIRAVA